MDRAQLLNDGEESLRIAFDGRLCALWTAMPGIVIDVDLVSMTCSVQPAIQGQVTNENGQVQSVNLPKLIKVPIVFPQAGGFAITLPLAANDEVLVVWASRCIDSWWQSGGYENQPMEARMHDLSDGFCIPGPCSQPNVISNISATGAQVRNRAGTSYVEIASDGKIKIVAPAEIDLTAPLVKVTGNLTVTGDINGTNITGTGILTGASLSVAGAGSLGSVTIGGIPFGTHRHTGVQSGLNDSGGPV